MTENDLKKSYEKDLNDISFELLKDIHDLTIKISDKMACHKERSVLIVTIGDKHPWHVIDFLKTRGIINSLHDNRGEILGRARGQASDFSIPEQKNISDVEINSDRFDIFLKVIKRIYNKKCQTLEDFNNTKSIPQKEAKETKVCPISSPSDEWKDISIKFINGHDVKIKIKDQTVDSDYKQMGFENKKNRNRIPNKQWEFLQELSENNGVKSWQTQSIENVYNDSGIVEKAFGDSFEKEKEESEDENRGFEIIKVPDEGKTTKKLLSKSLKSFFKLESDPFHPYKKEGAYCIKLQLIQE